MYQRGQSNNLIAHDLDCNFDFGLLYQDLHRWVQRSFVLNNSRVNPPRILANGKPELGTTCHIYQRGGFGGTRQKMWTIPTFCTVMLPAEVCGLRVTLMDQGDNQVVLNTFTVLMVYLR